MTSAISQFFCMHRKNLLANLVLRNFKVKFRGSVLGYLWTLVIPLSQVVVFFFVYQVVLKVPIPNYLAFIVTGVMPWVFFSTSVNDSLETLVSGQNLLTHLPMPIQAFPAATVLTNLISLILALPVVFGVLIWSEVPLSAHILWAIPLLAGLALLTYSMAFILACMFVLFRDLKYIFSILIGLWLYATPILYTTEMVPANYHWIFYFNPLTGFFVGFRQALLDQTHPDFFLLTVFFGWTGVLFLIANWVRARLAMRVIERL